MRDKSMRAFYFSVAPPTVNQQKVPALVKGKARLVKSKAYKAWISAAELEVLAQPGFAGDFVWRCDIFFPPSLSKADIDNIPKALIDVLVKMEKVPDDRYLAKLCIQWAEGDLIRVYARKEEIFEWFNIRKYSKAMIRKLSQNALL